MAASHYLADRDLQNSSLYLSLSTMTMLSNETEGVHQVLVSESLQTTRFVVLKILVPIVFTIGLLGNVLNIVVLCHPHMRSSTNVYLMVLGLADTFYLIFTLVLSFIHCSNRYQPYWMFKFIPYGRVVSDLAGNVAVWITVVFTMERYVAVSDPMRGKIWCTVSRACVSSFLVVVFCTVNTIPSLFELEITQRAEGGWKCKYSAMTKTTSYQIGYNWWYVTIFTLVPFVFLFIFNSLLIRTLFKAKRQREVLLQTNLGSVNVKHVSEENKVTLMLVTIVIIFILCQLPWTILLLYRSYLEDHGLPVPVNNVKIAGNICNILVQVNASVNFYLYSFFSRKFRKTLRVIFCFVTFLSEPASV